MALTNEIRNTLGNPTPLYFAAGVVDKLRAETPERIAAVRSTDPKELQEKVTAQAQETRARVSETLSNIDTDVKRLREQAQSFALQSVGVAAEYAVKARETYDELAERGRGAVRDWRSEADDEPEVRVERAPVRVAEPPVGDEGASRSASKPAGTANGTKANGTKANGTTPGGTGQRAGSEPAGRGASAKSTGTAKRTTPAKSTGAAKKTSSAKSTAAGGSRKGGTSGTSGAAGTSSANGTSTRPRKPSTGSDS